MVLKCNAWLKGSVLTTAFNSLGFAKMYTVNNTDGKLIGILGDMLNSLSSRLNFNMSPYGISVSDYGTQLPNGSFTGFVGMLQRGEFDIVAADTTITLQANTNCSRCLSKSVNKYDYIFQRSQVIEFSFPFQPAFYKILIKRPGHDMNWFTYTKGCRNISKGYVFKKACKFNSSV